MDRAMKEAIRRCCAEGPEAVEALFDQQNQLWLEKFAKLQKEAGDTFDRRLAEIAAIQTSIEQRLYACAMLTADVLPD